MKCEDYITLFCASSFFPLPLDFYFLRFKFSGSISRECTVKTDLEREGIGLELCGKLLPSASGENQKAGAQLHVPSFDELLTAAAQHTRVWKADGKGWREIQEEKGFFFSSPLFFKGEKGPEDEVLIRILFCYNG